MEFSAERENIIKAMEIAIRAIPNKTTMPVLHNFLIRVKDTEGEVIANGITEGITVKFATITAESGEVLVDAKTVLVAIKKMAKGEVSFKKEGEKLLVTGGKARYEFLAISDSFPDIPTVKDSISLKVDSFTFQKMINKVAFSADMVSADKMMSSVCMKIKNNRMSMIALDLKRVAIYEDDVESDDVEAIIPCKSMMELSKSLDIGDLEIEVSKNLIKFKFSSTEMVIQLVAGTYFNISKMLEAETTISVQINKNEFMGSIDRALVISDDKPMIISVQDCVARLSLQTNKTLFEEEIECTHDGNDIKIGINPAYLMDVIKAIDDEELNIYMVNSKTPVYIKNESEGYVYVIMPINI